MGNEISANPQPYKPRKPFRERFFSKVEMRDNGCWQWTAGKTSDGYGCFSVGGRRGGIVTEREWITALREAHLDPGDLDPEAAQ